MDIDTSAAELAGLLVSGGDGRLALDRRSGLNKYLCPPWPAPELACFASCTASPIAPEGLAAAQAALHRVACGTLAQEAERIAASLSGLLGLAGLAEVLLTPSGTDATLRALGLLVAEQPGRAVTSILVAGEETGAGVPLAAAGRQLSGATVAGFPEGMATVMVPVRHADGTERATDEVSADFAGAVAAARGRPVVHLIDCSKTGIVAPMTVPESVEVIVDACQARLPPERIRRYLRRGWPVLITGSKFYGGPAFSGAVLYPVARRTAEAEAEAEAVNLGTVLRWAAALDEMTRFAARPAAEVCAQMAAATEQVRVRIAAAPGLVPVALPAVDAEAWPSSILTFAIRGRTGLLTLPEVQERHRALAAAGVLVGQAVALGAHHGALRIAIGARTLREAGMEAKLDRLYHALGQTAGGRA